MQHPQRRVGEVVPVVGDRRPTRLQFRNVRAQRVRPQWIADQRDRVAGAQPRILYQGGDFADAVVVEVQDPQVLPSGERREILDAVALEVQFPQHGRLRQRGDLLQAAVIQRQFGQFRQALQRLRVIERRPRFVQM